MASTEFDEASDLMRRLVEVASNSWPEVDGRIDCSDRFSRFTSERDVVAELEVGDGSTRTAYAARQESCPLLAVRALIAQTPWAGRLL